MSQVKENRQQLNVQTKVWSKVLGIKPGIKGGQASFPKVFDYSEYNNVVSSY